MALNIPVTINDVTDGQVAGPGIFDVLMRGFKAHLEQEWNANRITGDDYTKAYIALTSMAMQQAMAFLLLPEQQENLSLQGDLIQEQIEAQRAQTLDTRTDGQVVKGTLGKQKDLYSQQITSYQRNAEVAAAKIFSDAWITQKTIDDGLVAPEVFQNSSVNTVMSRVRTNNGLDT